MVILLFDHNKSGCKDDYNDFVCAYRSYYESGSDKLLDFNN